ncbi:MAG: winged helix-turn-helix transcriptional regulator [Paludibacteraceae bacterium]|nr:winged helix-turn-helix transcriptional regulator [Paludibacteraceae bacterium]
MAIKENPKITRTELQNITGLSESGVKKILRQLQQKGLLRRIGPDKGGHWGDNRAGRLRDNR